MLQKADRQLGRAAQLNYIRIYIYINIRIYIHVYIANNSRMTC